MMHYGYGLGRGAASSACPYITGGYRGMHGGTPALWIGALGLLFLALIAVGAILLVVWATRKARPSTVYAPSAASTVPKDEAIEILRQEYAAGRIGRKEFQDKKKDLL